MSITKEQAIALYESRFWEQMDARQQASFQLHAKVLCMPFEVFHRALEEALGRPVWTHEMGVNWEGLKKELNGEQPSPSFEEIMDLIPADKRILVEVR